MRPTSGEEAILRLQGDGGEVVQLAFDGISARKVPAE